MHLSNNHTCKGVKGVFYDICDELKGKYPKDFKFTGWHPHCRCIATTITKTEAEMDADDEAILRGEQPSDPDTSANAVTELPDNFKQWVEDNEDRIARAKSKPYFLRDNEALINPPEPQQTDVFSILDKAVSGGYLPKSSVDKLREIAASGDTELFERRSATLQSVAERHDARTAEKRNKLIDVWEKRLEEHRLIKLAANNVFKVAFTYNEVDYSELMNELFHTTDLNKLRKATRKVANDIVEMRARERALMDLIPDVHTLHGTYTIAELEQAHAAIKRTFGRWVWDLESDASLTFLKERLEREITVVANSSYKTKQIAEDAFRRRLAIVKRRIEINKIKAGFSETFTFVSTTRSKVLKSLAAEIEAMIADDTIAPGTIRLATVSLKRKADELIAQQLARKARVSRVAAGAMSEEEIKREMVNFFRANGRTITEKEIIIQDGCVILTSSQHEALSQICDITSAEMRICKAHGDGGYIATGNSFTINGALRDVKGGGAHKIVGDVSSNPNIKLAMDRDGDKLKLDDLKTIKTMDAVIARNKLPFPIKLVRNLDANGVRPLFSGISGQRASEVARQIEALVDKSMRPDAGFMSASSNAQRNVFTSRDFQLQIEVPQGKPIFVTGNTFESECVLGRMTELEFKSVEYDAKRGKCIIKCVVK